MHAMDSGAQRLQQLLAAVGDPSRFQVVTELARRERHVSDLAEAIGLSQSCTTRHLQALERAGVVRTRRAGKRVMAALSLQDPDVARLLRWLGDVLELPGYGQPGRTGGKDDRRVPPQDAPPRQARRSPPRRGSTPMKPVATSPPAPRPGRAPRPERTRPEDRAHAGGDASDTPPSARRESPGGPRPRPEDLEDFLL